MSSRPERKRKRRIEEAARLGRLFERKPTSPVEDIWSVFSEYEKRSRAMALLERERRIAEGAANLGRLFNVDEAQVRAREILLTAPADVRHCPKLCAAFLREHADPDHLGTFPHGAIVLDEVADIEVTEPQLSDMLHKVFPNGLE